MESTTFVQRLAVRGALPRLAAKARESVRIGLVAPLSGPVQLWGQPGLNGCRIWADGVNNAGGVQVGCTRSQVELMPFDCRYDPNRAFRGIRKLVEEHQIRLLLTLGGDSLIRAREYLTDRKILTSTLLTSDLGPDAPYLVAPSELHPIVNVTAVDWLARNRPHLRRVAMCSQSDALGGPSLTTYRAACQVAGLQVVKEIQYGKRGANAADLVAAMLAESPDILCWCSSYTPMVHALTEAAYQLGFRGQILSCTLDDYPRLIARTSSAFMEGTLFQFPDFDDPALVGKAFFFYRPDEFFRRYNQLFSESWSAVAWEYAAILDIWHSAVRCAGTIEPISVLAAMKHSGEVMHPFGPAKWWGEEIFGIDNALVGDWPVVEIRAGKARIQEFISITGWLSQHSALLKQRMAEMGQLWDQRQRRPGLRIELAGHSLKI